jgi:uncharacterized membrane protein
MENGEVITDRMLVVVFDTESQAYEGRKALLGLENEGSIGVYASAVVAKKADGTVTVSQTDDPGPVGPLVGTFLGSIIGLLAGPAGVGIGAVVGFAGGSAAELNNARIAGDFIDDVSAELQPNKFAVVAEIREGWTTPVDTRMESIGGTVFRRALSEVADTVDEEEIVAMKADITQMKTEHRTVRADRKERLQEKINQLDAIIKARLETAKERRLAGKERARVKVEILKNKAAALRAKAAQAGDGIPD